MSSIAPATCLFCQHINPAGASFCNSCAAQLNLQPCLHCDAVDDRMATHCYKCGTPFPSRQMPEPDAAATAALTVIERSHEKTGPDIATVATVHRSGWLMSGTAFLLVLLAVSSYLYVRQPGKNMPTPDTKPLVQMAPTVPPVTTAPMTPAASAEAPQQIDVVVTPADTPRKTTVDASLAGTDAEAVTRRVPALGNECVPALATLGLCHPETGQEKP